MVKKEKMPNCPLVSVIVPTFNSEATITRCLQSVAKQTYPNIEVIVVDKYSTDATVKIAQDFHAQILLSHSERSGAKNQGAKQARGQFILFLDSDMELTSKVIEECVNTHLEEGAIAISIPEISMASNFFGECRSIEKTLLTANSSLDIPRFFLKEAFFDVGGFDEKLVCGEDADLHMRCKPFWHKIRRVNAEIRHYEGRLSLTNIVSKASLYGKSLPSFVKKNPSIAVKRYGYMQRMRFRSLKMWSKYPSHFLGFLLIKLVEYIAYFCGFLEHVCCGKVRITRTVRRIREAASTKWGRVTIDLAILTVLAVIVFRNFLFTSNWPAGGDIMGFISRSYLFGKDFRWLYIWHPHSFGFVEGINFMDFFLMLVYAACSDPFLTSKIFMFSAYLIAGFSMYAFVYSHTRRNLAALSASLVYMLNQWVFSQLTEAHIDIVYSYALAPVLLLLLDRALKIGRARDILYLALGISVFLTSFHPESIVMYGVFFMLFIIFYLIYPTKSDNFRKRFARVLRVALPTVLITSLLSAFWLVPFLSNVRAPYFFSSYAYPIEDATISSYKNLADAFTLRVAESWGYVKTIDVYAGLGFPEFPVYSFLLFLFASTYFVVLFFRRNRYTMFFTFSTLISTFVAKGPYPPFGEIFTWAWFNIPHFAVFRAANRWAMITAFSHAFFVSILITLIARYTDERKNIRDYETRARSPRRGLKRMTAIGLHPKVLTKIIKIHKFLYYSSTIMLIFILSSGFLSSYYFFSNGLQTFSLPRNYIEPLEWISGQPGDYKIVTVNKGSEEWIQNNDGSSDFAFSGMLTDIGWWHDIGFDSAFIHDKPTLQDGGWAPASRAFVDHLRFQTVRNFLTNDLLSILGTFNYRYVVMPPYTSQSAKSFFLNQKGFHVVYDQNSSVVIENDSWMPRFFGAKNHAFIIGGYGSFESLYKVDNFRFNETALIFLNQVSELQPYMNALFNSSQALIFSDSDPMEIVMLSLRDRATFIDAATYGLSSYDYAKYWTKAGSWRVLGRFVWGQDTLTTLGSEIVNIPFNVDSDDSYDLWIRIGVGPYRGRLSISIDGQFVREIQPRQSHYWLNLEWINLTRQNLAKGNHVLSLTNDGSGFNDIDEIAIIKPSLLENEKNKLSNALEGFDGRIIYSLEAENTFVTNQSNGWYVTLEPYSGYMLHSEGQSAETNSVSAKIFISRRRQYMFAARTFSGSDYGSLHVKIDNDTLTFPLTSQTRQIGWHEFGPVFFDIGEHSIGLSASGKVDLDMISIYSLNQRENSLLLKDVFNNDSNISVSYEKINPSKYNVHVNSENPFLLIFSESYHPLWKAYIGSKELSSTMVYSLVNSFSINETGKYDITVYFYGQTFADVGLQISTLALVGVVLTLIMGTRPFEKIRKKLRHMLSFQH